MLLFHFDKTGERRIADLGNLYYGQALFLVGGGPSVMVNERLAISDSVVASMSLNNAATTVQTTLWCGGDTPACYAPGILETPAIMKFGSLPHAETLVQGRPYFSYPNLFFYIPETDVPWHRFLDVQPNVPWYHNTLFSAIHIAYVLGFRRIYLVGCSFGFNGDRVYAHKTKLSEPELDWNRRLYSYQAEELCALKPLFDKAGLEIFDSSVTSRLAGTYRSVSLESALHQEFVGLHKDLLTAFDTERLPHSSRFAGRTISDIIESRLTPETRRDRPITVI